MNLILYIILIIIILLIFLFNIKDKDELYNNILPYDVVVVGCARNIAQYLPKTKTKLNMFNKLFKKTNIIIYENDSTDQTLEILKEWEKENFIELITEKNVPGKRTERLAHGRNILYKKAMTMKFDLFIVIDLDNIIDKLDEEGILSCFNMKEDWGAVGGNFINYYYDIWALRTFDDWMPFDFEYCKHIEKKGIDYCQNSRIRTIPPNHPPIKVKSCFGGLVIYKRQFLDNCSYGTGKYPNLNNGQVIEDCEHIVFNECVSKNGANFYINPKMIVS